MSTEPEVKFLAVLVCGGRDYGDRAAVYGALDKINRLQPVDIVIQGGATGADYLGDKWARNREIACHREPAKWNAYGKSAGHRRNAVMATMLANMPGAKICLAFPGGRGTENMIDKIVQLNEQGAGIELVRVGLNDGTGRV